MDNGVPSCSHVNLPCQKVSAHRFTHIGLPLEVFDFNQLKTLTIVVVIQELKAPAASARGSWGPEGRCVHHNSASLPSSTASVTALMPRVWCRLVALETTILGHRRLRSRVVCWCWWWWWWLAVSRTTCHCHSSCHPQPRLPFQKFEGRKS